jgi:hypothetical protein
LDEVLRPKERGARVDQTVGKRKEHQTELTKRMNEEARVRKKGVVGGKGVEKGMPGGTK